MEYSLAPTGERFPLPEALDEELEVQRLKEIVGEQRLLGREIVVVMGVGFVGAVMAAVVADTVRADGSPGKFVIGVQRPSPRSYWKIPCLNRGVSPVKAEDPEVDPLIRRCVLEKKTLMATYSMEALTLADVVVVDVQCDFLKEELGNVKSGSAEIQALEESFRIMGRKIPPQALVLIETTVPPGTTEYIAYPFFKKAFEERGITGEPLLAHSFERVMPGRQYVSSIRNFWRVCSGINPEARERVVRFLSEVIEVEKYPLTVLDRPVESETCKIVENSFRATLLAFMHEWTLFAERNGVDLVKVIEAIRVRPTHSNILFPGPGVGGYCLPKDGGLGFWSYKHLMGFEDDIFKITPLAININDTRALHAAQLVRDALRNRNRIVASSLISVLGVSYREDVGDTRYSGSEILVRKLAEMGAEVRVHDPYVEHWWELEKQDDYPLHNSWSRFFRNQDGLAKLTVSQDLAQTVQGADAVVLAVRHQPYLGLDPDQVVEWIGRPAAIVDCFGILNDDQIRRYFELGCEVKGSGRGHISRIKREVLGGKNKTRMLDKDKRRCWIKNPHALGGSHLEMLVFRSFLASPISSPLFSVHIARTYDEREIFRFVDKEYDEISSGVSPPQGRVDVLPIAMPMLCKTKKRTAKEDLFDLIFRHMVLDRQLLHDNGETRKFP